MSIRVSINNRGTAGKKLRQSGQQVTNKTSPHSIPKSLQQATYLHMSHKLQGFVVADFPFVSGVSLFYVCMVNRNIPLPTLGWGLICAFQQRLQVMYIPWKHCVEIKLFFLCSALRKRKKIRILMAQVKG